VSSEDFTPEEVPCRDEEVLSRDEVLSKAEPGRVSKTTMQEWEQEKNTKEQPLLADAAGRVISSSGSGHGSCFLL